jgi:tRNA pseudouridine55 synthase
MPSAAPDVYLHGWLILDKPVGIGSTPCVSAVKRALRAAGSAKHRVGHGGTLDPLASGVLPIAIGEATKLAGRMLDATKQYDFTVRFGEETSTLDTEGDVIATSAVRPSPEQTRAVLPQFTGPLEQIPPAYSALKIDGKRAYHLARAGEEVALQSRRVIIHSLSIIECSRDTATFSATVSKGTYIRSLARDIAQALGTVGHVTMLRRTKAGPFHLSQAITLDFLEETAKARTLDGAVLPLVAGLDDIPALPVTPEDALLLRQGRQLLGFRVSPGPYLATDDDRPVAMVEASDSGLRVVRGFNI